MGVSPRCVWFLINAHQDVEMGELRKMLGVEMREIAQLQKKINTLVCLSFVCVCVCACAFFPYY